jgi:hypothetical protein
MGFSVQVNDARRCKRSSPSSPPQVSRAAHVGHGYSTSAIASVLSRITGEGRERGQNVGPGSPSRWRDVCRILRRKRGTICPESGTMSFIAGRLIHKGSSARPMTARKAHRLSPSRTARNAQELPLSWSIWLRCAPRACWTMRSSVQPRHASSTGAVSGRASTLALCRSRLVGDRLRMGTAGPGKIE